MKDEKILRTMRDKNRPEETNKQTEHPIQHWANWRKVFTRIFQEVMIFLPHQVLQESERKKKKMGNTVSNTAKEIRQLNIKGARKKETKDVLNNMQDLEYKQRKINKLTIPKACPL